MNKHTFLHIALGVLIGNATALLLLAGAGHVFAVESPTTPSPMAITTGSHVFAYRGYMEIDGLAYDGDIPMEVTLQSGGSSYSEGHAAVSVVNGQFQILVGTGDGGGLPDWVFTSEGVELTLSVDGTVLTNRQRLYPAVNAVAHFDLESPIFSGHTQLDEGVSFPARPLEWPHDADDLQVRMTRGTNIPTGFGLGPENRIVYDAFQHWFFAGSDRGQAHTRTEAQLNINENGIDTRDVIANDITLRDDSTLTFGDDGAVEFSGGGVSIAENRVTLGSAASQLRLVDDARIHFDAGALLAGRPRMVGGELELWESVLDMDDRYNWIILAGAMTWRGPYVDATQHITVGSTGDHAAYCQTGGFMLGLRWDASEERITPICTNAVRDTRP